MAGYVLLAGMILALQSLSLYVVCGSQADRREVVEPNGSQRRMQLTVTPNKVEISHLEEQIAELNGGQP